MDASPEQPPLKSRTPRAFAIALGEFFATAITKSPPTIETGAAHGQRWVKTAQQHLRQVWRKSHDRPMRPQWDLVDPRVTPSKRAARRCMTGRYVPRVRNGPR